MTEPPHHATPESPGSPRDAESDGSTEAASPVPCEPPVPPAPLGTPDAPGGPADSGSAGGSRALLPPLVAALVVALLALAAHTNVCDRAFLPAEAPNPLSPFGLDSIAAANVEHVLTPPHEDGDQPVARIAHRAAYAVAGWAAPKHHFAGALLHAAASVALLASVLALGGSHGLALFVACAFALHPLGVEPTAWVSMKARLLAGLFGFLALATWRRRAWLGTVCVVLALASHPIAAAVPLVLLLVDGELRGARRWRGLPLVLGGCAWVVVAWVNDGAALLPFEQRLLFAPLAIARLTWHAFAPFELSVSYSHPALTGAGGSLALAVLGWIALAAASALVVARLRRHDAPRAVALGCAWFLAAALVAALLPYGDSLGPDRDAYLALPGLLLALASAASAALARGVLFTRDLRAPLAVACTALLALLSLSRADAWRDGLALTADAVEDDATDPGVWRMRGEELVRRGKLTDATRAFERTLAALPDDPGALVGLAVIDLRRPLVAEAEEKLARALERVPTDPSAHQLLAEALLKRGDREAMPTAVEHFAEALRFAPYVSRVRTRMAYSLAVLGRTDEARAQASAALAFDPRAREAWFAIGKAYQQDRDPRTALASYREALAIEPDYAEALSDAGNLELETGQVDAALRTLERAYFLHPEYLEGVYSLAVAYERVGRLDEATKFQELVLQKNPGHMRATVALAWLYAGAGRVDEALELGRRALQSNAQHAGARELLARIALEASEWKKAAGHLRVASQAQPQRTDLAILLIRVLATAPDDDARNGGEALSLARNWNARTDGNDAEMLAAFAAALAETGALEEALRTIDRALAVAPGERRVELVAERAAYARGEPVRWSE